MARTRHPSAARNAFPPPAPPAPLPSRAAVRRMDSGWENQFTGVGTAIDRRVHNTFGVAPRLTDQEIDELVRGDDMAAKIVNKPANDMLRAGFEITIEAPKKKAQPPGEAAPIGVEGDDDGDTEEEPAKPAPKADAFPPKGGAPAFGDPPPEKPPGVIAAPDEGSRQQADDTMAALEELEVSEKFAEALRWRRAKGGSAIFVGVEGATRQDQPLDPESIKAIKFLTVFEKAELYPVQWYANPFEPKFGMPAVYQIQPRGVPAFGAKGERSHVNTYARVHETRLIVFQGVVTSREQLVSENGWGDSVLTVCMNVLRDFDTVWSSTATLMADFSQPVFKIKALAEALASDRKDILQNRIKALMLSRSLLKAAVIDAEEDFTRDTASLTGLSELLDKWCSRLAAAAEMPITMLMGQSPGGMNATGESDTRGYYDSIKAKQETELRKALERLIRLLMLSKEGPTKGVEPDDWRLKFNPLWQMTDKEKADIYVQQSTGDKAYVDMGAATGEEIAASRFSKPDSEIVIDFEGREEMAVEHEAEAAERAEEMQKAAKAMPAAGAPGAKPAKPAPFGA